MALAKSASWEDYDEAVSLCEILDVAPLDVFARVKMVLARTAVTKHEAIILSVLKSPLEKMDKAAKKNKLKAVTKTIDSQTAAWGEDIRSHIHPVLMREATQLCMQ